MPGIEKEDLILLLLAAPGGESAGGELAGATRLEKLIFLAQQELDAIKGKVEHFEFRPWKFGPFSQQVYEALDTLCSIDLLDIHERDVASPYPEVAESEELVEVAEGEPVVEKVFRLTERGRKVAGVLRQQVPADVWEAICQLKKRFGRLTLTRLIHYVYHKYPETTTESVLDHLKPRD